jgi:hypothetical protein
MALQVERECRADGTQEDGDRGDRLAQPGTGPEQAGAGAGHGSTIHRPGFWIGLRSPGSP